MANKEEKKLQEREKALEQREKELDAREKIVAESEKSLLTSRQELADLTREIEEKEKHLNAKEIELADWTIDLEAREKAVNEGKPEPAVEKDVKVFSRADEELIAEGMEAYGIDPEYVMATGIDPETGDAFILTNGGSRVRYSAKRDPRDGPIKPLTYIQVTGINPEWDKRKVIAGKKKNPEPEKTEPGEPQADQAG